MCVCCIENCYAKSRDNFNKSSMLGKCSWKLKLMFTVRANGDRGRGQGKAINAAAKQRPRRSNP